MHRIQIQLTAEQEKALREMARLRGSSISALVREGVEQLLGPEKKKREQARERALTFIGSFADEPDVSRRHDDYLADAIEEDLRENKPR